MIRLFETRDFEQAENFSRPIYYPKLWEPNDSYSVRIKLFPQGCLAAEENGQLMGYCFGHPWLFDQIVPLGAVIQLPDKPDCFYIHDLAVHGEHRKVGVGKCLAEKMIEIAKGLGFDKMKLVSVLNSHGFWEKHGFKIVDRIDYTPEVPGFVMTRDGLVAQSGERLVCIQEVAGA